MDEQVRWPNEQGGLAWASQRTKDSSSRLYDWAANQVRVGMFPAVDPDDVTQLTR